MRFISMSFAREGAMNTRNAAHRHQNADRDFFTHQHEHSADHCDGDCDEHAAVRRTMSASAAGGR